MFKFHLLKGQTGNDLFWESKNINPYSINILQDINDENSTEIEVPVTSIPSPFARPQLFETAFDFVSRLKTKEELEGHSSYHRLVSDCLDVYEFLFRIDELSLKSKVEFIKWTPADLKFMTDDLASESEKSFAETINLYIKKYNESMKVNAFSQCYIILYNSIPIAGTSPYTGFFTTPNTIDAKINFFGKRHFFNGDPVPLFNRDFDFQKFIHLFINRNRLSNRFKALSDYLNKTRSFVDDEGMKKFFAEIGRETFTIDDYEPISFGDSPLYIWPDVPYRKKIVKDDSNIDLIHQSDYLLSTSKHLDNPPIVLKEGLKNAHWKFLKSTLQQGFTIPEEVKNEPDISNRILPEISAVYPCIHIDDFLSEYLFELDYPLNWEKFFTGTSKISTKGFLLPINPQYFSYFTFNDLKKNLKIEVIEQKGGTEYQVQLKVPIKADGGKAQITFERTYIAYENLQNKSKGKGAVLKIRLYMGFYPFFRLGAVDENTGMFNANSFSVYNDFYKTLIYYEDSIKVGCSFYKYTLSSDQLKQLKSNENNVPASRTRKEENWGYITDYYELSNTLDNKDRDITYDFIGLRVQHKELDKAADAVVIPLMYLAKSDEVGYNSYVAFDIGTTNSFVAFAKEQSIPQPFTSTFKHRVTSFTEVQMVMLHKPSDDIDITGSDRFDFNLKVANRYLSALLNEFMPSLIDDKSKFKFPIKTVICWDSDFDISDKTKLSILGNVNIPFAFGIRTKRPVDRISTNLKWNVSDTVDKVAKNQLLSFIKQLVIMARNTLILNSCNPQKSIVIWFKPSSMGAGISKVFGEIWEELYNDYFLKQPVKDKNYPKKIEENLRRISESAAPFFALAPDIIGDYFLNIDIGGGTSDAVVFKRDKIAVSTSFRFAGNALFGNGLDPRKVGQDNGFAKKYTSIIKNELSRVEDDERGIVLAAFSSDTSLRSNDIVNFLFTVDEFKDYLKKDKYLKVLLLMHNVALFYHTAQLMKNMDLDIPKHIGLSGNGSHILELTNGSAKLNVKGGLAEVVTHVFRKIFNKKEDSRKIVFTNSLTPKECTAFGGIIGCHDKKADSDEDYFIGLGDEDTVETHSIARNRSYTDLANDVELIDKVTQNVYKFFEYFFGELWKDCNFCENFLVSQELDPKKLKDYVCNESEIKDCIRSGIEFRKKDKESEMNETLFFYPIVNYIYDLSIILTSNEVDSFKHN